MAGEGGFTPENITLAKKDTQVKRNPFKEAYTKVKEKAKLAQLFRRNSQVNSDPLESPLSNEQLKSIDPALFSEDIQKSTQSESEQDTRSELEKKLNDFEKKIATASTPTELFQIPVLDSRFDREATGFKFYTIIKPILDSTDWSPDMNFSQGFANPELAKCKKTYDLLAEKAKEVGIDDEWIKRSVDHAIELKNNEKRRIMEIFKPGKFIAHAGYTRELPSVLKADGLASSWSAVNNELMSPNDIKRFVGGSNADSNALFFYPLDHQSGGVYVETNYGTGKSSSDHPEMNTDMAYIYPSEYLVQHSGAVGIKGQEVFVTGSEDAIKNGGLTRASDDTQILPLDGAYIVLPQPKYQEAVTQLIATGKTQEWVDHHVMQIPFINGLVSSRPNGWDSMMSAKPAVNEWLQKQHQSAYKDVRIGIKPQVLHSGANYDLIEVEYS